MTTLALSQRTAHQKIATLHIPKIPWKIWYAVGIFFFLAMIVSYIFLVNELTKGSYMIKNYNTKIDNLLSENRKLETNFAESSFLGGVEAKVYALGFEKTTQVTYVQLLDNSLGMAK